MLNAIPEIRHDATFPPLQTSPDQHRSHTQAVRSPSVCRRWYLHIIANCKRSSNPTRTPVPSLDTPIISHRCPRSNSVMNGTEYTSSRPPTLDALVVVDTVARQTREDSADNEGVEADAALQGFQSRRGKGEGRDSPRVLLRSRLSERCPSYS